MVIAFQSNRTSVSYGSFVVYASWRQRLQGLLCTSRAHEPIMLSACHAIHTWGMSYAIDVVFLSADMHVLQAYTHVTAGRMLSCAGACAVLERPAQVAVWPHAGEQLEGTIWSVAS